jgi:hypothetical protein
LTIQDLGSLGELLAAVATLATLGYLAVQVGQARRQLETSQIQARIAWRNVSFSFSNAVIGFLENDVRPKLPR